jgi:hypothetical protein
VAAAKKAADGRGISRPVSRGIVAMASAPASGRRRRGYGVLSLKLPATFFENGAAMTLSQQIPD